MACAYVSDTPSEPDPIAGPAYAIGFENGRDGMAHAFWAAVCESRARKLQESADKIRFGVGWGDKRNRKQARNYERCAARFLRWAKETA